VSPVSWTVSVFMASASVGTMIYVIIICINIQDMRRMIDAYLLPCPAHIAHTSGIALLMRTLWPWEYGQK